MTTAKLDSIQAGYKGMKPTCRAGTGIHQGVHACWEVSCDSRPSVEMSTAVQEGALLTLHTASRDGKRKKVQPSTAEESNIDWLNSDLYSNLTKQIESSHKCNLSLNNLPGKTTVVQYYTCNLNWQNITFHTLVLIKQTGKTPFSWSEFHKIVWQNFIRTSHSL